MSGPRRWPRIPRAQSSSPNASTSSARTPGPLTMNGTGSPEWITSGYVGVAWSPVTQTIARSVGSSPSSASSASIVRFLIVRILRVAGEIGRLEVREDESVALVEPLAGQLHAGAQVRGRVTGLGDVARLEADRARETEQELRVAEEAPVHAVALAEASDSTAAAPTT